MISLLKPVAFLFAIRTSDRVASPTHPQSRQQTLVLSSSSNNNASADTESVEALIAAARQSLSQNDTGTAFSYLARAQAKNPLAPGLQSTFEDLFRTRIQLHNESIDRIGLGCLLLERGSYAKAAHQFQAVVFNSNQQLDEALRDRAVTSLFKARAAICDWKTIEQDSIALVKSVQSCLHASSSLSSPNRVPSVHPYEALMWPCISVQVAGRIAASYAERAIASVGLTTGVDLSYFRVTGVNEKMHTFYDVPEIRVKTVQTIDKTPKVRTSSFATDGPKRKLRVGYISPDFTGKHPLGFLMQNVFRFHNFDEFDVFVYSLMDDDNSKEVQKIKESCTEWKVLSQSSGTISTSQDAAQIIKADNLDVLVDYTMYVGASIGVEIMAQRPAKVQISHMGFPASSGAPFIDYLVCDETVVPPQYRQFYSENLLFMPHCFFANSHRYLEISSDSPNECAQPHDNEKAVDKLREKYGLPQSGFVYCCHNRPEKLDPYTFKSWLRVLKEVPNSVLWMLSTGKEMEENLLQFVSSEGFGALTERIVFCDMVPRDEHLKRLHQVADLFLDTPAYNAHTTGCDCLIAGVPMVSLLRPCASIVPKGEVATEKIASRVGPSFLRTLHLDELVAESLGDYEDIMIRCATDHHWFTAMKNRLKINGSTSPLFDTNRWVRNWEAGLTEVSTNANSRGRDVYVVDDTS